MEFTSTVVTTFNVFGLCQPQLDLSGTEKSMTLLSQLSLTQPQHCLWSCLLLLCTRVQCGETTCVRIVDNTAGQLATLSDPKQCDISDGDPAGDPLAGDDDEQDDTVRPEKYI